MSTVKKKAVTVVRLTEKPGKKGEKPIVKDIQPGTVFDCPKNLVEELTEAGAITAPGKTTPTEAAASAPQANADEDENEGEGEDVALSKDTLIQKAKGLGVKGINKNWSVEKLNEAIEAAEAEAAEGGDDDGEGDDDAEDVM